MFLQHFDYFCYRSNDNFHATKKMHEQHIATWSYTKFHEASLNNFLSYLGIQISADRQMDGRTDRQTVGKPIVPPV